MRLLFNLFLLSAIVLSSVSVSAQGLLMADYQQKGSNNTDESLNYHRNELEVGTNNAKASLNVGIGFLSSTSKWRALPHLKKAYQQDSVVSDHIHYYLGLAHQYNMDFMDALKSFHKAKLSSVNYTDSILRDIDLRIAQCKTGISLKSRDDFHVENVGTNPVISSRVNTKDFFGSSSCLSSHGKSVYFISDRPGGMGGNDIYVSYLMPDGVWGEAVNLGPEVNTRANEESPFISHDGTILFFSSEGHMGIGGYDIFYVMKDENQQWTAPMNIGLSVNSPQDDLSFVLDRNGFKGYFSATRSDNNGTTDIYQVTVEPNQIQEGSTLVSKLKKSIQSQGYPARNARFDLSSATYEIK